MHQSRYFVRGVETGTIAAITQASHFLGHHCFPAVYDVVAQFPQASNGNIFVYSMAGKGLEVLSDIIPVWKVQQQSTPGRKQPESLADNFLVYQGSLYSLPYRDRM